MHHALSKLLQECSVENALRCSLSQEKCTQLINRGREIVLTIEHNHNHQNGL